ncbi:MAG TPA: D-2-hydroxyacid dehydrogenase family protein [Chloroflexota bacterium]|nr:D-2-hydroxyacid dehydrogenase family protein [Chloroflexota bacterium]
MRVAILDDIHNAYDRQPAVHRLRQRAEVRIFTEPFGDPANLRGFEAVVANRERTRFTRELLQQLPDLKLIVQTGNHAYHVDFAAAKELGITVARTAGHYDTRPGFKGTSGVVELTLGLILALLRHIVSSDAGMRRGEWPAPLSYELLGKTLGIVGVGNVGARVAKLADAFGMRLLAWSPSLTDERAKGIGAERRDLDDLLRQSDVVSIHVPLSPQSRNLIGARELGLMRPTSYLINTSRGPIVTETALIETLKAGRIAGAGLDVFDQEPLPRDHPLRSLPNVVLTPHLGWPTDNAYAAFAEVTVGALLNYMDGNSVLKFEEDVA